METLTNFNDLVPLLFFVWLSIRQNIDQNFRDIRYVEEWRTRDLPVSLLAERGRR